MVELQPVPDHHGRITGHDVSIECLRQRTADATQVPSPSRFNAARACPLARECNFLLWVYSLDCFVVIFSSCCSHLGSAERKWTSKTSRVLGGNRKAVHIQNLENPESRSSLSSWLFLHRLVYSRIDKQKLQTSSFRETFQMLLFCAGTSDKVRCFHCGGSLSNWRLLDNPFTEHARCFPSCSYIQSIQRLNRKEGKYWLYAQKVKE